MSALIIALAMGVVLISAFEAHVVNVTAQIENALSVTPNKMMFGTVFPQEQLQEEFTVSLSDSFLDQDRVNMVKYTINKKQKPRHEITSFPSGVSGHEYCLNNQPIDPGDSNDPYYLFCYPDLCDRITTELSGVNNTSGNLTVSSSSDSWKVNLKVPCFEKLCDQGYDYDYHNYQLSIYDVQTKVLAKANLFLSHRKELQYLPRFFSKHQCHKNQRHHFHIIVHELFPFFLLSLQVFLT